MTKAVIINKGNPEPLTFSGALDSSPFARNGDVMRLLVFYSDKVKKNKKEKIKVKILELDRYFNQEGKTVDEGSADDTITEFTGFLENKEGKFFFSEMNTENKIDWAKTAPYPWFRVTFAGENDTVKNKPENETSAETFPVVIGKNDEPPESPVFEIGFIIEKEDGSFVGSSGSLVKYFYGDYLYKPFFDLFDIRTQLDSINLLNITNAQIKHAPDRNDSNNDLIHTTVSSTTGVYDNTIDAYNMKKMKAIDAALKKIDKLIKTSKNPYFQNIQTVNEYYKKLELYKGQVEAYNPSLMDIDCFRLEVGIIRPMAQELNELENDVHKYLKMNGQPPKSYLNRIDKNIAIITRNKKIDEILNNPAVQMMGLLPGAGVITGTLKLIQGKYFDGFLDVFGAIVTYGSFLKLSRVARAFRKSSKTTVEMLYSYRYRKLVSSITSTKVMNKITETSLKHSGTFLGNLFYTVGTFKSLKGHVDSIALLHKNRKYIIEMTEKAIKGIQMGKIADSRSYLEFLNKLGNTNAAAEFFAHLRVLHATVKGSKSAYAVTLEAMDDVNKLLGIKELPGVQEFDPLVVDNTKTLFRMLGEMDVDIDNVVDSQTKTFPNTSSIIEHFNNSLIQYDMFGLKINADVRYKNNRAEMLLALDEVSELWEAQMKDRDKWIQANRYRYENKEVRCMQKQWAYKNKSSLSSSLPESLETRISNFIQKIKGQIALREALTGKNELMFLESAIISNVDSQTNCIFDFNADFFCEHGRNLVNKYY